MHEKDLEMQTHWQGHYLDGRSAARQVVSLQLMPTGLQIITESEERLYWPYEEIRQTQGFYAGEQVRLEHGGELPEILLLADAAFLHDLRRIAPRLSRHFHDPAQRRFRVQLTVFAALASIGLSAVFYIWGIPALVSLVLARIPVAWEERLGEIVVAQLAPKDTHCSDPAQVAALHKILTTLTAPLKQSPYTFRLIVVDTPAVNAAAAPGGYILLFRGLLHQAEDAEEVAGVLAHEVQHILQQHTTRALLQQLSTSFLFSLLVGDVSGPLASGLEGAHMLNMLRHNRRQEEEADRKGMLLLLDAGVDPHGMIQFFDKLEQKSGGEPAFLQYVSTHPHSADRVAKLQALIPESPTSVKKLLANENWSEMKKICQKNT